MRWIRWRQKTAANAPRPGDARASRRRAQGPPTGFAPRSLGSCEGFYSIIICNKRCSIYCDVLVKVLGGRWGDFLIWKFVSPRSILKSISFFLFKCELWNPIESTTFWYSTRPTSTSQSFRVMGVDSDPDRPPHHPGWSVRAVSLQLLSKNSKYWEKPDFTLRSGK